MSDEYCDGNPAEESFVDDSVKESTSLDLKMALGLLPNASTEMLYRAMLKDESLRDGIVSILREYFRDMWRDR